MGPEGSLLDEAVCSRFRSLLNSIHRMDESFKLKHHKRGPIPQQTQDPEKGRLLKEKAAVYTAVQIVCELNPRRDSDIGWTSRELIAR